MDGSSFYILLQRVALIAPGFLLAITVHEVAHGYVALRYGDPTAKLAGRLTFNPISHLDPLGTLFLVLTVMTGKGIGWAKPVPVDPRYLRDPRKDMMWISLAGPAANMVTATVLAFIFHAVVFLFAGARVGSTSRLVVEPLFGMLYLGVGINIVLAIFNLLPVPPLDGSKILGGLLPREYAYKLDQFEQYGFIILLILLFSGALRYLILPPINFVESILLGGLV